MVKHGTKISGHLLTLSAHLKQKMPGSSILQEGAENETSKKLRAQLLELNKEALRRNTHNHSDITPDDGYKGF